MAESYKPAPLPETKDYFNAVNAVESKISSSGKEPRAFFLRQFNITPSAENFTSEAYQLGRLLEPIDRSTRQAVDPEYQGAHAFTLGAVAGKLVSLEAHGALVRQSEVLGAMQGLPVNMDVNDQLELYNRASQAFRTMGEEGMKFIGEILEKHFDDWAEASVEDVTKQRNFKIGAGIVLIAGRQFHAERIRQYDLEEMRRLAERVHDTDWDTEFMELLDGGN